MRPIFGLRGGWIYQNIVINMQGTISTTETVENDFCGIGPKAGIESEWTLQRFKQNKLALVADFYASYLYGHWNISDVVYDTVNTTLYTNAGSRNLGALTLQGMVGVGLNTKRISIKFGYEFADWFNQYQVFDDGTGAHNNDLILQGLTLKMIYTF